MYTALMEGLTATIIGMGIVFGVLALLAYVITFLKLADQEKPIADSITADLEETDVLSDEAEQYDSAINFDDNELIAVISAAVTAYMGETPYKIKSVSKAKNTASPWNIAARRENQRGIKY